MASTGANRRIALFHNPIAGGGKASRRLPSVEFYLRTEGIAYDIIGLSYPATLDHFTDVLIMGGDGTVNHVLNHFPDVRLPIGVIPAGTANDLAVELMDSEDFQACLQTAVHGKTCWIDAGRCNGQLYMNCLGVGFDGEVARDIRKVFLLQGYLRYLYAVLRKIFQYRSVIMHTSWDGGQYQYSAMTIMAANSRLSGGGFRVAPQANTQDGKLDMVVIDDIPLWKRLWYLPRVRKGGHLQLPFVRTARFTRMHIQLDSPLQAHLDGELMMHNEYLIEIVPSKFRFRVAEAYCQS